MDSFRIGYIDGPWVNFEPPISGGVFRPYEGEANMRKCAKTITTTLCPSKTSALPGTDGTCNKKGAPPPCPDEKPLLSSVQDKLDVNQLVTGTLDKFPRSCTQVEFMDLAEQLEIDSDIGRFPSVDPATQRTIINRYRQLHQKVQDDGHYECRFWEYGKECIRYVSIFALSMTALKYEWYMTSAMLLGLFWHQIMFTAHDAGHLAITHNYIADTLIGIFIADFCCGLSIGWWKSSHNVHHLVPNHPVSPS
jgi:delta8-fatty-acid desaturase